MDLNVLLSFKNTFKHSLEVKMRTFRTGILNMGIIYFKYYVNQIYMQLLIHCNHFTEKIWK